MNNHCPNCKKELQENEKFCTNCGIKLGNIDEKNKLEEQTIQEEQEAKKYGSITTGMILITLMFYILEKIYKYKALQIINPIFIIATYLLFLYTIERFSNVNSGKIFPIKFIKTLKSATLNLILVSVLILGFIYISKYILFKTCNG